MDNHKAIVMGRIEKLRYTYKVYNSFIPKIEKRNELVEYKEFWSGELENPPLEKGDSLYVKELNLKVIIIDKAKSTDGGYVYWTHHVIEEIEDEKTQETKLQSEQAEMDHKKRMEEREKTQELNEEPTKKSKKWWQFWK